MPQADDIYMITEKQTVARRTTLMSVGVNIVLLVLQLVIGVLAHSQALIADGIHSVSDLIADLIVLIANKRSNVPPDHDHNYGHGRYETVASLFLGGLLLVVGAGMLWRAGERLTDMANAPTVHVTALIVAVLAIVSKEALFRYMLRAAKRVRLSLLIANAWHARSDAASSLVVAVGILGSVLGYKVLDPIAASIVGFMVVRMGWTFAWNALQDLSDRALDSDDAAQMRLALQASSDVREVTELKTRKMGDNVLVDAHLLVDPRISVSEGHYIAESARARLKGDPRILEVLIHVDPEDDEIARPTPLGLPTRSALLARTQALLMSLGLSVSRMDLHYLEGAIDVDIFIPVHRTSSGAFVLSGEPAAHDSDIRAVIDVLDPKRLALALEVRRVSVFLAPSNI